MKTENMRVAVLGSGNIGSAIARGLVKAGVVPAGQVILTRRKEEHLEGFRREGFIAGTDNKEAVRDTQLVVIAVTPQQLNGLLSEIRDVLDSRRHTVISVVSGATIAEIRSHLGSAVPIIRANAQHGNRNSGIDDVSFHR